MGFVVENVCLLFESSNRVVYLMVFVNYLLWIETDVTTLVFNAIIVQ